MKKFTFLLFSLVVVCSYGQVSINETFDSGTPAGWTESYSNTTSQVCAGQSERDNLYSGSATGNMTSPNQAAASNGTDITFSIDYKVVDWSAATTATADGWGSADLQYSTDNGFNWITAGTIDDSNDSNSNVCTTFSVTILGAAVPTSSDLRFRVLNTWAAGDYYFYIDDFSANQVALLPPNCDSSLTSATTDFAIDGTLTWSLATGAPTGYKISVGSSMGGTDIANNVDVGNTTSYTPAGLNYSTTYYTTITPYNANGDATGCTEESFAVEAAPPTGSLCTDPIDASSLPYIAAAETTAGFGDDYSGSAGASGCGSTSPYLNGDDIVYAHTASADGSIDVNLTNIGSTYTGVFIYDDCVDIGTACAAGDTNGSSTADLSITNFPVTNGSTYYIVISTWATPQSTTYDLAITSGATCFDITGLALDSSTATSAAISWTAAGSETAWEIAVQADGTGMPGAADGSGTDTTTNPHTESGLTANTAYEVYVRAECTAGTDFGGWVGPLDFTTACAALTPDYAADMSSNVPDSCWEEAGSGEVAAGPGGLGASDWRQGTSYAVGSSNAINLFAGNSDREWLLSPGFDLSADGYELVVNVAVSEWQDGFTAATMGSDDEVQLLMSVDGGATWTNLTTWNVGNQPALAGTEYIEDLTGITGTGVRFAIWASDGTTDDTEDYDFHVGRFEVRTPPSCPDVSSVMVSNLGATTADIAWTNGGTETDWEVAIQSPGTGTPGGAGTATSSNPYNATGLTESTAYEVYVRSDCGGGQLGNWVGPVNFSTTATPVASFPYDEDFDSGAGGWTADNTNNGSWALGAPANTIINSADSGTDAWVTNLTGNYLASDDSFVNSPPFDMSGLTAPVIEMSVWYNAEFSWDGMLLQSSIDGGTSWQNVGAFGDPNNWYNDNSVNGTDAWTGRNSSGNGSGGWLAAKNDLTGLGGQSSVMLRVAFYSDGSGQDEGVAFDTVSIYDPACPDVTAVNVSNLTTTTADIGWTNGGSETAWEVAIQAQGTGTPGGAGTATGANPYNATGLTSQTDYEVWVRADCGGAGFGTWVGPIDFSTPCNTFSLPLVEGFESGVPPTCWTSFRGTNGEGTGFDWTTNGFSNSGASAAFVRYENVATAAEDWLVTPALDMSTATNPELSFYASQDFGSDFGSVYTVRVSTTDTDHASFTTVQTYTEADFSVDSYDQYIVDLSAYASEATVYVAFVMDNDDGDNWYLDDVLIYDNVPTTFTFTSGTWAPFDPMGLASSDDDVIIAAGNSSMSSDLSCSTMTVNPGAGLIIESGVTLTTVVGTTLESSSTSYSSLILDGAVVGGILYERHVNMNGSGSTGSNDLVSAPLTGEAFNTFASSNNNILNNGTLFLFGPFEKVTGQYVNWAATETSTLDPGVGYRTGTTDNGFVTFVGTANNGTVTNDIINGGSNNEEWNLVGNPYPSYLNVQDFLNHDVGGVTNLQLFDAPTAAIYGYDGSALNGWTVYNLATTTASTVIAPGQGFFVSADATNVGPYDLEFTPSMRSTGSSDDFIVGRNAELKYVKLSASTNNDVFGTDIYFNANASLGFDLGYDAALWGDTTPDFALYSSLVQDNSGRAMALQAVNSNDLSDVVIPLGVNANQGEQLTFSIAEMNLPANVSVYLEDYVENTVTLLNDSDYVITPNTDLTGTGRFFLRTSEDALSTIDNSLDNLEIFTLKASQELVVNGQLLDSNSTLNLYDIQGRLVLTTKLDDTALQNRIDVSNINTGVYIATVQSNDQEKTKKVIID